jgi:hypothetical protein
MFSSIDGIDRGLVTVSSARHGRNKKGTDHVSVNGPKTTPWNSMTSFFISENATIPDFSS